jgi:S1-C subfamily serine protease
MVSRHLIAGSRHLVAGSRVAACALLLALAAKSARADDRAKTLRDRLDDAKASLVTVELTSRVTVERVPGLGEGAKRIVRTETTGVVVAADGLVALAEARVDPSAAAFALLGSRARPEIEKVLVLGSDGKAREATWVGRDEERGLAFVRVGETARAGLKPAVLPETSPLPDVGEELAVVSIAPRALGRAPRVEITRVSLATEKPRRLLGMSPPLPDSLGGLVYRVEGASAPVGIVIGLPGGAAAPSDGAGKDMLTPDLLEAAAAPYVLPVSDLRDSAAKPPTEGKVTAAVKRARSWLGIRSEAMTPELAKLHKLAVDDGVRVVKVYKDTPAEKAGFAENDVITRFEGELVSLDPGETFRTLEDVGVGQKVKLTLVHDGKAKELEIALAEAPPAPEDAPRRRVTALEGLVRDLTFFDRDELSLPADAPGTVVLELDPDGAGSRAGLRAQDAILQVEGKDTPGVDALVEALGDSGERALTVRRGGDKLSLKLRR